MVYYIGVSKFFQKCKVIIADNIFKCKKVRDRSRAVSLMSKKIIAAVIIGLSIMSSTGYAVFSWAQTQNRALSEAADASENIPGNTESIKDYEKELTQYGQIEKARVESKKENRIAIMEGNRIIIYKDELDTLTDELLVKGVDEKQAKSEAEKMLLREAALYIMAKDKGLEVSDEEVLEVIEVNKEQCLKASNYNDFETFLKAADMTSDEYWDNQFDILKKKITVSKFKDEYVKENMGKFKKFIGTSEYEPAVEKELNEIADKFIKKDKVKKLQ